MKTNLTADQHRAEADQCRRMAKTLDSARTLRCMAFAHQYRIRARWHERRAAEKALNIHTPSDMQIRLRNDDDVLGLIRQHKRWHTFTDADFREDTK